MHCSPASAKERSSLAVEVFIIVETELNDVASCQSVHGDSSLVVSRVVSTRTRFLPWIVNAFDGN